MSALQSEVDVLREQLAAKEAIIAHNQFEKGGYLVYGKTGWIGGKLIRLLTKAGETIHLGTARLENREDLQREIDATKPEFVLNAAGVTGRPNVDWCEDHRPETIRVNVIGCLNLVDVCNERGIHVTNFATGCIYEYDDAHPIGGGEGKMFTEEDTPNYDSSFYSLSKAMVEQLLCNFGNVLVLRLRMPISADLHPRNLITKISSYERVINIPNSMTVLYELLPVALDMTKRRLKGVYNFVNPGAISHNQILDLYSEYVDPTFAYQNFTVEEQDKILKCGRSNNELDTTKFLAANPDLKITPIKECIVEVMKKMRDNLDKGLNEDGGLVGGQRRSCITGCGKSEF